MDAMNKTTSDKLKYVIFLVFLLSLFIPFLQKQFDLIKEKPLNGFFDVATFPEFKKETWKTGMFQQNFEKAINENLGFHDWFVKLQCQINYSLYNISKFQTVIIGKNGYLYDKGYIDGYTGRDFIGKERIELQIEKARVVKNELKKKNIEVLFAFAPGKASYFPEFIPDKLNEFSSKDSNNYQCYINALKKTDLNFIDLRNYFISLKDKTKFPIYSQIGVHWGQYACYLAIDTIAKKIEQIKNIRLTNFGINKIKLGDTLIRTDKDEGSLLNVFSELPFYKMAYLNLTYSSDSNSVKPNLLAISDSYFSNIVATNIVDSVFSGWSYWNYNNGESSDKNDKVFRLKKEIEKRDVVLLLATDASLAAFPFGFIDQAYELYSPKNKAYYILKQKEYKLFILETMKNINTNKVWKKQLIDNAKQKGISQTDEFINAAIWCYNEKERILKEKINN